MSEQKQTAQEAAFRDAEVWVAKEQGWPIGREVRLAQLLTTRESALRAEIERLKAVALGGKLCISQQHETLETERDVLKAELLRRSTREVEWDRERREELDIFVRRAERAEAQLAALQAEERVYTAALAAAEKVADLRGNDLNVQLDIMTKLRDQLAASQERVKRLEEAVRKVRMRYEEGDPMDSAELERLECEALAAGGEEGK